MWFGGLVVWWFGGLVRAGLICAPAALESKEKRTARTLRVAQKHMICTRFVSLA
jgi:hypothetical protein